MIQDIVSLVLLFGSVNLPLHFTEEQREISAEIIEQANLLGEDPYLLMAIAYTETRIRREETLASFRSTTDSGHPSGDTSLVKLLGKIWTTLSTAPLQR